MKEAKLYPKWEDIVEFGADGPKPKELIVTPDFKSVIVGLDAEQVIPPHQAQAATYHFLRGTGQLTAGREEIEVEPGATIVVQDGVPRGMKAVTQMVFLAAHGPSKGKPPKKSSLMIVMGVLVMFAVMFGVMIVPMIMSRADAAMTGITWLSFVPFAALVIMAVVMTFLFRRMSQRFSGAHMHGMEAHKPNKASKELEDNS